MFGLGAMLTCIYGNFDPKLSKETYWSFALNQSIRLLSINEQKTVGA